MVPGAPGYSVFYITALDTVGSATFRATEARGGTVWQTSEFTVTVAQDDRVAPAPVQPAVIDLRDIEEWNKYEAEGLTLEAGSEIKLILWENPSAQYTWSFDEAAANGFFSIHSEFIQGAARSGSSRRGLGLPGQRVFTLNAGDFGGEAAFVCWISGGRFGSEGAEDAAASGWGYLSIDVTVVGPDPLPMETIDLSYAEDREALSRSGYTLQPGQQVKFVLPENPTTGYRWVQDPQVAWVYFTAEHEYVPSQGAAGGQDDDEPALGMGGAKHITVTAGETQGSGVFYACETRGREVSYQSFPDQDIDCVEFQIHVQRPWDESWWIGDLREERDLNYVTTQTVPFFPGEIAKF